MVSVLENLRSFLKGLGIEPREIHHEPTFTSEQSAAARGEELKVGGKALLIKVDKQFQLFVLPANRRADSKRIRNFLQAKKSRFATPEELLDLTGLVPGSVPPFGRPVLDFDLYIDSSLTENDRIAFNAGSLTDSMILKMEDYLNAAKPVDTCPFSIETSS